MQQNKAYYCPDDETSDSIEEFETNRGAGEEISWYLYQQIFRANLGER